MSDVEIIAAGESPIGTIILQRREVSSQPGEPVTEITLDHQFLMSSLATDSERALARRALAMHAGAALDLLVGGLGLGYTAREVLRDDRVARLEVVELLAPVIEWLERGLVPLATELKADARLAVRCGDVYRQLAALPARRWDVILVDVDHSPEERLGDASASFYTDVGLEQAKRHLRDGGILGVWSYAESPAFAAALRRVFRDVCVESVQFENRAIDAVETNWLFFARD